MEQFLLPEQSPEEQGREASRLAIAMLHAAEAPAGPMPVVLGPGESGILLHEAVGHGLEADFNRKRTSNYTDQVGQVVGLAWTEVGGDLLTIEAAVIPGKGVITHRLHVPLGRKQDVPQITKQIHRQHLTGCDCRPCDVGATLSRDHDEP